MIADIVSGSGQLEFSSTRSPEYQYVTRTQTPASENGFEYFGNAAAIKPHSACIYIRACQLEYKTLHPLHCCIKVCRYGSQRPQDLSRTAYIPQWRCVLKQGWLALVTQTETNRCRSIISCHHLYSYLIHVHRSAVL